MGRFGLTVEFFRSRDYDVVEARHVRDHVVWLRFRDGRSGEIDLEPELRGPVFEPLKTPEAFRQFFVHPEFATLAWPNDSDIAPEFLHANVRLVDPPPISRFFGIVITMYYDEHGPPHFHARSGGDEVSVEIENLKVRGEFPGTSLRLVLDWAELHRAELLENWDRARLALPLVPVEPLRTSSAASKTTMGSSSWRFSNGASLSKLDTSATRAVRTPRTSAPLPQPGQSSTLKSVVSR